MSQCQKPSGRTFIKSVPTPKSIAPSALPYLHLHSISGQAPIAFLVSFNYVKYHSRHNRSNHWVDDVNNRRYDNIGLEQVWHTKCWETRQCTFICSVAEANLVNSRARARQGKPTPQLAFRRQLALKILTNNIVDDEMSICSPIVIRKRRRTEIRVGHELTVRPNFTGIWKTNDNTWAKVRTKYLKTKCSGCKI